ncbi:MAG TPA: hypothetical protein VG324_03070 [Blastocatellia bacterium]|nr:hypothetical protein [Blastocatellia bacterium]
MRKHHFISSLVIFVAGFALSAIIDGRRLASLSQGTISNPAEAEVAAQTTQKPSTSQKWEYRIITGHVRQVVEIELNRLGEQGFEVCGVAQSGIDPGPALLSVALRRPK